MIGFYGYTMLLTYINAVCAMAGFYFALSGRVKYAVICLAVCGVFDVFDGVIARTKKNRSEREKSYGVQIDSLTDVVCFGMLPVAIGYSLGLDKLHHIVIMSVYILATLIRLAFFNVTEIEMQRQNIKRTHYMGLPVTFAAVIIPLVYFLVDIREYPVIYIITLLVMSAAYLVKIKVPKVRLDDSLDALQKNTALLDETAITIDGEIGETANGVV